MHPGLPQDFQKQVLLVACGNTISPVVKQLLAQTSNGRGIDAEEARATSPSRLAPPLSPFRFPSSATPPTSPISVERHPAHQPAPVC